MSLLLSFLPFPPFPRPRVRRLRGSPGVPRKQQLRPLFPCPGPAISASSLERAPRNRAFPCLLRTTRVLLRAPRGPTFFENLGFTSYNS